MYRTLTISLPPKVKREIDHVGVPFIAESIGCAPATLRKILDGQWDYVHRSVLERLLDHWQLDAADFFQLRPSTFWTPFEQVRSCTILTAAEKSDLFGSDLRVITELKSSIPQLVKGCQVSVPDIELGDREAVLRHVNSTNTIVVGSPRSNPATEIILTECLSEPSASPSLIKNIQFVWPELLRAASDTESQFSRWAKERFGLIAGDRGQLVAEAHYRPRNQFLSESIRRASDCALVVVQNRQSDGGDMPLKTIILAGFTSIGTLAAAKALVRDFRSLEPKKKRGILVGGLAVTYKKTMADGDNRVITKIDWRYLEGGRDSMKVRFEK